MEFEKILDNVEVTKTKRGISFNFTWRVIALALLSIITWAVFQIKHIQVQNRQTQLENHELLHHLDSVALVVSLDIATIKDNEKNERVARETLSERITAVESQYNFMRGQLSRRNGIYGDKD